jgi:UDP-glucose 4-epimerase
VKERSKVLVTGGAGFIGSHVADAYLRAGHEVFVVDDLSSGKRANVSDDATFVQADIGSPEVADLIRREEFDLVNNHAAQIDVRISVADPRRDAATNLDGLLNLLEAAREAGTRRFIHVSSGGVVYGEPEIRPTPETYPKLPLSPYGVTKLAGEYYLNYYRRVHGLEYVALRYSNVFGPRQDPHGEAGVIAIFCSRLLSGEGLTIFGDGEQTRDYVYVHDVVAANMLASQMRLPDTPAGTTPGLDEWAFNVGTGVGTSVNRLADLLERIAEATPAREYRSERPGELRHSTLDASKLGTRGWAPSRTLSEGLKETYLHIAEHGSSAS